MAQVVDYSEARPAPAAIAALPAIGAMRYLAPLPNRKVIQKPEQDALHAAGLLVGYVWETTADRASRGYSAGRDDAVRANGMADTLGVPATVPIYYAVDFDAPTPPLTVIGPYFTGVRDASDGRRPWGVYGEYDVVEAYGEKTPWLWQCAAWSGNGQGSGGSIQKRRLSKYACLFQRVGYVLGDTCDVNDVLANDWGGWNPSITPPSEEDDMTSTLMADPFVPGQWWEVLGLDRRLVNMAFGTAELDILRYTITLAGGAVLDENSNIDFRRFLMNARIPKVVASGGGAAPEEIARQVEAALSDNFAAIGPQVIDALQAQLNK